MDVTAELPLPSDGCVLAPSPRTGGKPSSLRRESQPFLFHLALPHSLHGNFIWFFKIRAWQPNALSGNQQGAPRYVEGSTSCFCLEMSCASFRDKYTSS